MRGGVGFQRCHRLKGAEKGAGPGSAGPALHAEPLTSLPAGDPAPFPASEAPPRAPAPGPSTQDPNKTRAPRCRDPALPGNKKSLAYWPRVQLATRPVKLTAIGQYAGVPSQASGYLSQLPFGGSADCRGGRVPPVPSQKTVNGLPIRRTKTQNDQKVNWKRPAK